MNKIKEIRGILGVSQKVFCETYGIPRRTLEDWERGIKEPAPYLIALLERVVREDAETKKKEEEEK